MSTNRGIFDSFPSQPVNRQDSPFSVAQAPERGDSPFRVVDEAAPGAGAEAGKAAKLPERRKTESPFQVAEPSEGFGFEAPAAFEGSPFQAAPAAAAAPAAPVQPVSPFSLAAQTVPASPFAMDPAPQPSAPVTAFAQWQEPAPQRASAPAKEEAVPPPFAPSVQVPSVFGTPQPPEQPAAPAPAPVAAPVAAPAPAPAPAPVAASAPAPAPAPVVETSTPSPEPQSSQNSDSYSIRQLELRAIFGVDREMTGDEILQRSRALPGMRNIARVDPQGMTTIDALKSLLPTLGFGSGSLKLYSGSVPLEFIREGSVLLAVQTDGGFAPGVRETLMIVARELDRMG